MKQTVRKKILCLCVLSLFLCGCGKKEEAVKKEEVKEEEITLVKNDLYVEPLQPTTIQKKAFNLLSKAVKEEHDAQEAKMAAVSFALDFFTLSNKKGSEDVGGVQYVPLNMVWEFKEYAQAYFYNHYNTIVSEYGKEALPEVINYKVNKATADVFEYYQKQYEGYVVDLALTYKESDFDEKQLKKNVKITVINIRDLKYDRSKVYKDYNDFMGDPIHTYKVIALQ